MAEFVLENVPSNARSGTLLSHLECNHQTEHTDGRSESGMR